MSLTLFKAIPTTFTRIQYGVGDGAFKLWIHIIYMGPELGT